jgi:hypothetical protein
LVEIIIPASIEGLINWCFSECESLSSIRFESGVNLSRIEARTFNTTVLVEIIIPSSVEVLDENYFSVCGSLSSVIFESGLRLARSEKQSFRGTGLVEIILRALAEVFVNIGFLNAAYFHRLHFKQCRICGKSAETLFHV